MIRLDSARPDDLAPARGGVLVPTMGALHEGHLALVRAAIGTGRRPVVVTVFVNPTQFAPGEDYERYPRTLEADAARCEAAGVDVLFAPGVEVVYPDGLAVRPPLDPLPAVATEPGLEDAARPTHFAGVCQVVHRLFDLLRPTAAVFGLKDYQQFLVLRAMVDRLELGVEMIGHPIVRDADGLALSSRNVCLAPVQRRRALGLPQAIAAAADEADPESAEARMRSILLANQIAIDYAVVRDAETLGPIDRSNPDRPARALVAGRVGPVRLIDNGPVGPVGP